MLRTLERLLAIEATDLGGALNEAAQLLSTAFMADKVDVFLLEPATQTLVALGISDTPMGRRQRAIGLDRLPLANGGTTVRVVTTGRLFRTGHADQEADELPGIVQGLGAQSIITVPLQVGDERRGALQATSVQPDFFSAGDLEFLEACAHWVESVAQRGELIEQWTQQAVAQGRQVAAEELVTTLAHDLRNYLTPLKSRIDLLYLRAQRAQRGMTFATPERRSRRLDGSRT
jgi:transcriptional regulator with GAF, ATPase, and Fis domain